MSLGKMSKSISRHFSAPVDKPVRTIHVNDQERNAEFGYQNNFVRTTRYTPLTFLPKNLFEQLHRLANVYFLTIATLQVTTDLSPTGKYTTIGPLMLILGVSAVKDAIEDIARHRSDVATNSRLVDVLTSGGWEKKPWKDITVGNYVKIENRDLFPADLLLMCSSEPMGMAYIETSNLDGETNLKIRQALVETNDPLTGSQADGQVNTEILSQFTATITCELPNNKLNEFEGSLKCDGSDYSLTNQQILLRGSQLRQTKWAVGCVIFSGYDTKIVMNSNKAPSKRSNIEVRTNDFILVILSLMFILCCTMGTVAVVWGDDKMDESWYLPTSKGSTVFVEIFGTFLILLSTMVPISLYVTLEIVKMFQAFHMNWDRDMYHDETETFALARSSGLNEELGQVEYIFSDKTGTLTQNLMEFRKCTIAGVKYGKGTTEIGKAAALRQGRVLSDEGLDPDFEKPDPMFNFQDDSLLANLNNGNHADSQQIKEFLTMLAVCHTVIPEKDDKGETVYQAASPDEAALVAAGKCFGFVFSTRTPKGITVMIQGEEVEFEVLNVLEFNSDRKRMSVVVRRGGSDEIVLMCKGADSVIYDLLAPGQQEAEITNGHLKDFANEGLRTLCLAYRTLPQHEWEGWNERYQQASNSLEDRRKKLDKVAEEVEKELVFLGTTAIEDKLQDGVPDCIATLAKANIKIWVLTGDKQETAINIGFACALLNNDMTLLILNEKDELSARTALESERSRYFNLSAGAAKEVAIVVDGKTLEFILNNDEMKFMFLELGKVSKAVVCCRVTPKQKADVTSLIKVYDGRITLAIGDGANDVAMIQAAHVGVGISGREGLQAVQSSDYAIAQFRFLKKLLLVHGHWNYRRISRVITFNFYKNITLYMTQFWFGLYNMGSGQTLYEAWTASSYNVFFTSLPILAYGILDQDVGVRGLLSFPKIYRIGQDKELFNAKMFAFWLCNALWHSAVCFLIPMTIFLSIVSDDGTDRGLFSMGMFAYTGVIYTVSGKVFLMTRTHNWLTGTTLSLSVLAWFLWLLVYSFVILEPDQLTIWRLGYYVMSLPSWWLCTFLVPIAALSRDFAWRCYKDCFTTNQVVKANIVNHFDLWDVIKDPQGAQQQAENQRQGVRI